MIDVDRLVEQLYQHTLDTPEITKEKMRITLSLALQKQCNNDLETICKYRNRWDDTEKHNLNGMSNNDPTSRAIRLLFSLIIEDINNEAKQYESDLSK